MEMADQGIVKQVVNEQFHNYQVQGVTFDALNSDEIARYSEVDVLNYHMYDQATRAPHIFGPLDSRLGSTSKHGICATCKLGFDDCIGHFGHIKLALPVYHIGYLKHVRNIISSLCKTCGRVLISEEVRKGRLARLRRSTPDDKKRLHSKLIEMCKKVTTCPHCKSYNHKVKAMAGVGLMLRHEIGFAKNVPQSAQANFKYAFQDATESNKEIGDFIGKAAETMTPLTAYNLLRNLSAQDRELLDVVDPQRLLLTCIPVPPVCIRPSVKIGDSATNEDDLTFLIGEIVKLNQRLREMMDTGSRVEEILNVWQMMQDQVAYWINSEATGLLPLKKPIRSICSRLKGKEGRFRGNLSGKRVDFSGRSVISPDPNVSVEQLVVPDWVARRMTFPERVCDANIERLRASIVRGNDEHPGAYCVRMADSVRPKHLRLPKNFRRKIAAELKTGSVVERHMIDGDIVLFNRQPSLHRLSIMAHRAKIMKGRTFRFNECVCAPYNADFDGDEMNIHLPQTDEARAEALHLMGVRHGLVTPKSGEVVVHATQDFLTASFLLTQKDVYLSRDKFCQLCCYITDGNEPIDLPPPAILKPVELWTGKQAFNVLLRPNKKSKVLVNLEVPEKNYSKSRESMCPQDGWVIFRNSELVCGNLGKKVLGGNKSGLFFRLIRDNSADAAVACMTRCAKVSSRWLMNRGMTIGIDDVTATEHMEEEKRQIVKRNYANVDAAIAEFNAGTLKNKPGCDAKQTLESMVNGQLGDIRAKIGDKCETDLPRFNKPRIMATCGSKGSAINLCQMMACVGQQNVGGERIKPGFVNRTLPHFLKFDKKPEARGFVANSFCSGLKPSEFFFHTMGGREGLVDTAVKTAETGYMQRRLIKALEDLSLKYDLTVRTSTSEVVQFAFGDDGLNPLKMEGQNSKPIDFDYVMKHVQHTLRTPRALVRTERGGMPVSAILPRWHVAASGPQAKRRRISSQPQVGALQLPPMPDKGATDCILRSKEQMNTIEFRERPLLPFEMMSLVEGYADRFHDWVKRTHGTAVIEISEARADLARYIMKIAVGVAQKRQDLLGLEPGDTAESVAKARAEAKPGENLLVENLGLCPTQMQLEAFVNRCSNKYVQGQLMPGEAVGAVAAQSIGEPATQMTLKTFHFAGVASMNVTLGVPRIREIINAAKTISTPIITGQLVNQVDESSARIVRGRIERTMLGDLCKYFKESYEPGVGCYISVKLDIVAIERLGLELTVAQVKDALMADRKIGGIQIFKGTKDKLKIEIRKNDKMRVFPAVPPGKNVKQDPLLVFQLQALKAALPKAVVVGLKTTTRAVINKIDKDPMGNKLDKTHHELLVEGHGLKEIMNIPGICGTKTTSNHIPEVEKVLGIEAARRTIMNETKSTLKPHGIEVDSRHIQMLGDCMTYRGSVLGITRFGISKMNKTALMLASFERPTDHIFDAAAHGVSDPIKGVSECIILGSTVNLGTGLFRLHYDAKEAAKVAARERAVPVAAGRFATPGAGSAGSATVPVPVPPALSEWRKMRREMPG